MVLYMVRHHGQFSAVNSLTLCVAPDGEFSSTAVGCIGLGTACMCLAEVLVSGVAQWWWGEGRQVCCMSYRRWVCQGTAKIKMCLPRDCYRAPAMHGPVNNLINGTQNKSQLVQQILM
jgi:hypothetical protein